MQSRCFLIENLMENKSKSRLKTQKQYCHLNMAINSLLINKARKSLINHTYIFKDVHICLVNKTIDLVIDLKCISLNTMKKQNKTIKNNNLNQFAKTTNHYSIDMKLDNFIVHKSLIN